LVPHLAEGLLDNQIVTTGAPVQKAVWLVSAMLIAVLLIALAIFQFRHSDPYVRNVLALQGDSLQGQIIFQLNCAGCHGIDADGRVGPSLHRVATRKSRFGLIHQVISGETPPMPQFQPTPQEMADLLQYLEGL
jgi:mono/diheme cytochrome c family protein